MPRAAAGGGGARGIFRKDEFQYLPELDAYRCPSGQELKPLRHGKMRELGRIEYDNVAFVALARCGRAARTEQRTPSLALAMRLSSTACPHGSQRDLKFSIFGVRLSSIRSAASSSGCIKARSDVRGEFSLTALAYNMRRARRRRERRQGRWPRSRKGSGIARRSPFMALLATRGCAKHRSGRWLQTSDNARLSDVPTQRQPRRLGRPAVAKSADMG